MKIGWFDNIEIVNESPAHFCGVYAIVNLATRMAYIGSSTSVAARYAAHTRQLNDHLREGLSHNNQALQNDWDIYGEDLFELVLLEACPKGMLLTREQRWLDFFGMENIYNERKASDINAAVDTALAQDIRELKESGHSIKEISLLLQIDERRIYGVVERVMHTTDYAPISPKKHVLWDAERFAQCDRTINN